MQGVGNSEGKSEIAPVETQPTRQAARQEIPKRRCGKGHDEQHERGSRCDADDQPDAIHTRHHGGDDDGHQRQRRGDGAEHGPSVHEAQAARSAGGCVRVHKKSPVWKG